MKKRIVVILGPTASGKTALSIETAKLMDGEIVGAGSMQVYKGISIGSAKPAPGEMSGIRHHMIDIIAPSESFSAAQYRQMAGECVDDIHERGKLPIVTGGTGLYINSILYDMDFGSTSADEEYRQRLLTLANSFGRSYIYNILRETDEAAAARIKPNDTKRVIRALEMNRAGDRVRDFKQNKLNPGPYECLVFGLNVPRDELYGRINQRVDKMMSDGLVEEVKRLLEMGCGKDATALSYIGYKEILGALRGEYDLKTAVENIKRNTRRYAKRQMTWFKSIENVIWLEAGNIATDGRLHELSHEIEEGCKRNEY